MTPRREGSLSTAAQSLPDLWRITRRLRPTHHVPDVTSLNEAFIARHDVAALIWDVDGTLMAYHHGRVDDQLTTTLDDLKVPQAILSNCGEDRFHELGTIFPELPVLKGYRLENAEIVFRRLWRGHEQWTSGTGGTRREIERPSGALTPLRKPSAALVDHALAELGVERGPRVFMVGDQYFTDVAGANFAGIGSIKVDTLRPDTFPLSIRILQRIERVLFLLLHGRAHP